MMEKGPNNLNEDGLVNSAKKEKEVREGRRNFLKAVLGGAVVGATAVTGIDKIIKQKKESESLASLFEGQEENFLKANQAANMLINEMNIANVQRVRLFGDEPKNERIGFLREFLSKHLNSKVGHRYYSKGGILAEGFYTADNLSRIMAESSMILDQKNYVNIDPPKGPDGNVTPQAQGFKYNKRKEM